jgi:hypothetical protein
VSRRPDVRDGEAPGEDADNVYLWEYLAQRGERTEPGAYEAWLRQGGPSAFERRVRCVRRYAFGVPNRAALEAIARYAPIVELGAGTGYWAYLLRNRGVDILAYDLAPPGLAQNAYKFEPRTWTEVRLGGVDVLAEQHADRALLLCWPGYRDTFADEALAAYRGHVLIYVGEGPGGHTANDAFFGQLQRDWTPVAQIAIPQWSGAHDSLSIYDRRPRL